MCGLGKMGWILLWVLCGCTQVAQAQFAVIDAASVTQLISEVKTLEEQLSTARASLAQTQAAFESTVGDRGMERLLAGAPRNYLPSDWSGVQAAVQGSSSAYPGLSGDVSAALAANAVLTSQQVASLPPAAGQQLQEQRRTIALLQAVSHQALMTTSSRFTALQQLIGAIASAGDQKSALDLQARIGAEAGMLQNEQTKLQVLYQSALAEQWANEERARERLAVGHGQFATRFQPLP